MSFDSVLQSDGVVVDLFSYDLVLFPAVEIVLHVEVFVVDIGVFVVAVVVVDIGVIVVDVVVVYIDIDLFVVVVDIVVAQLLDLFPDYLTGTGGFL